MPAVEPYGAFAAIRSVLEGVGLTADAALFGVRVQPSPLRHRSFRLDLGAFRFGLGERQKPGDGVNGVEQVTVRFAHDYSPDATGSHDASFELACSDLIAAVHALLTDPRTRGAIRMNDGAGARRVAGHTIETDLTLAVHWSTTLPAADSA